MIAYQNWPIFKNNAPDMQGGLKEEPVLRTVLEDRGLYDFWFKQDSCFTDICTDFYDPDVANDAYRLTFEIAKQLQKAKDVGGILYPTVANNYRGLNIAIPVNVARRHLAPVSAWLFQFGGQIDPPGTGPRLYEGSVIRLGMFDAAGNVLWGPTGNWSPEALHLQIAPVPKRPVNTA